MNRRIFATCCVVFGVIALLVSVVMACVLSRVITSFLSGPMTRETAEAMIDVLRAYAYGMFPGACMMVLGLSVAWLQQIRVAPKGRRT